LDAVGVTRERCWRYDWVLEFDIKGLFDNIPHDLLLNPYLTHTINIHLKTIHCVIKSLGVALQLEK